jgi:hypothetical protein
MSSQISNCARYLISVHKSALLVYFLVQLPKFYLVMDLIGISLVLLIGSSVLLRIIDLDPLIVLAFALITS